MTSEVIDDSTWTDGDGQHEVANPSQCHLRRIEGSRSYWPAAH